MLGPSPSGSVCPGPSLKEVGGTLRKLGSEESDPEGEGGFTLSSRGSGFTAQGCPFAPSAGCSRTVPSQQDKGTQGHTAPGRASHLQTDLRRTCVLIKARKWLERAKSFPEGTIAKGHKVK